jgi:TonB family protein
MQLDLNPSASTAKAPPAFWRRWGGYAIGAVVALIAVAVVWYLLAGTASTKREAPSTPMLVLQPPPPPPPPPQPEKLPEPEKVKPEVVEPKPEPTPAEPKPAEDTPNPAKDLSDPVTMNADGQAGTDAFGIGAGKGGGMSGSGAGGGNATYGRYFGYVLQQALSRDERARRLVFLMQVNVWLDPNGRLTRVELVHGSGNADTDQAVLTALRSIEKVDERPPASLQFPQRVTLQGKRPAG